MAEISIPFVYIQFLKIYKIAQKQNYITGNNLTAMSAWSIKLVLLLYNMRQTQRTLFRPHLRKYLQRNTNFDILL